MTKVNDEWNLLVDWNFEYQMKLLFRGGFGYPISSHRKLTWKEKTREEKVT